ncbi:MAG: alpha/beta fold hydrolase [Pyrinomonadaceae bacterium]
MGEHLMISKLKGYLSTRKFVSMSSFLFCAVLLLVSVPAAMAQKASTTAGESRYATLDGARIHYKDYGKGREALVLIHGWTCNLDHWRNQIPDFAKRSRVIALDLPGHGQSDKPEIRYDMDLFAKAIDAVMRDAKVERGVIVGHSMGTPVARQFYRKYPKKTLASVVVDGGLRLFGTKEMRDGFLDAFRAPTYKETAPKMFAGMAGPYLSTELREQIATSFLNTPQYVLVSAMESMSEESLYGPDKINEAVIAFLNQKALLK